MERSQWTAVYVGVVVAFGLLVEFAGRGWPPSFADSIRWATVIMFVFGVTLNIRNVFARRGTTHAFVLLLAAVNFVLMGGLVVVDRMRHLGDNVTMNTGLSFTAVAIGLWCAILINANRFELGTDRQEDVDFWHPDQEAPKGG